MTQLKKADRTKPDLGTVQETLLTPLCARADQYGLPDAIVNDQRAMEIVRSMEYDFDKIRKFPDTLTGCAIRAAIFDRWIAEFLKQHQDATIVLIGEGLDTTYDRNDNGRAEWFEIDFPDVIQLRRQLIGASERRTMIGGSVFEEDWIEEVRSAGPRPTLFQAAGVFMYLPEEKIRSLLRLLADHFPGSTLLFDSCSTMAKRNSHRWEATVRTTNAVYQWGTDDPRSIAKWDERFQVTDVEYMMNHHRKQWSLKTRFWSTLSADLRHGYQLNRAVLG